MSEQEIQEEIAEVEKEIADLEAELDTLRDTIRTLEIRKRKLVGQLGPDERVNQLFK